LDTLTSHFAPAVRFDRVTCQLNKHKVLDQISLTIRRGAITGILGPNGAGKTTLLHMITGLRRPSSGTISVFSEQLPARSRKLRQKIGVVLQETALYDELTVFENLRFTASLYAIAEPRRRIDEVLELLALSEWASERVNNLSGGYQRRVVIARALLHAPDLLIIDEPTLGVDVEARHAIWSHLRLLKARGTTIIVATNYLDEALALCDSVAVLRAGKLLTCEAPEKLIARVGSCLDIECTDAAAEAIRREFADNEGILRITSTSTGLSIFLTGRIAPDELMREILQITSIKGFRERGADLAEVFRALEEVSS
jgi:ABC-2 type transport system ATP-binding protein